MLRHYTELLIAAAIAGAVLAGLGAWELFKYDDCRSVGHAPIICIAAII